MNQIRVLQSSRASAGRSEDRVLSLPREKILVLADGFGGPVAGVGAADRACSAVHQFLVHEAGDLEATLPFVMRSYFSLAGNVLFNAIVHANRLLLGSNAGKSVHEKGGASLAAAFLDGEVLSIASVGACCAWFLREERMTPVLIPRTWGRLLDPSKGGATPEARLPLMALGISEDLEPEVIEVRVQPGDRLWLGSFEPQITDLQAWSRVSFDTPTEDLSAWSSDTYGADRSWVLWGF